MTVTRKSKIENGKSLHRAEEYGRMRRQLSGETNSNQVFLFEREFQWAFQIMSRLLSNIFFGAYVLESV